MQKTFNWQKLQMPYELILAVLAFVNIYFYYFQLHGVLDASGIEVAMVIDYITIGIFSADYLIRLFLAENKKHFVTHNVLDLIAIIPLSPAFRVARLVRCGILFARFFKIIRRFSSYNMFLYVLFAAVVVLFTSALLIAPIEKMTFFEGLWWGVVTIATVGYGDFIPVTTAGRIIAMVLMFCGIGFLSFLTGTVTTHYVNLHMDKIGDNSSRGILKYYQKQIFYFHSMSVEDIDDMCKVLKSLKAEEEVLAKTPRDVSSDLASQKKTPPMDIEKD